MLIKETIPFQNTITASTSRTLCSKQIASKFWTWKFIMHFPDDANYGLLYQWYLAQDNKYTDPAVPSGILLWLDESEHDAWRGDNMTIEVAHMRLVTDVPAFLKLYTTNNVAKELPISCFAEIMREVKV